jgi:sugar lactone lactonase YvrE
VVAHRGTGEILAVAPDGASEVVARVPPDTLPFSLDRLPDGQLLVVAGTELLRREPDGALGTHADLGHLAGGFNEIVVDGRGNVFVNGADSTEDGGFAPGIVAVVTPDGAARQVAEGLAFGNGMAVTADDRTLIVADSWAHRLIGYDIAPDGGLGPARTWADLDEGTPDGICLDAEGAVWFADVPNRNCVRVREGGEVLQTVPLDRGGFACMLGGPDGRTLHVLAAEFTGFDTMFDGPPSGQLLAVEVDVPHAGRP